jgi:spore coat protein U-like protein
MKFSHAIQTAMPAAILGCLTLGFAPIPAAASTATANITVSATVLTACTINATPLAFGNYDGTTEIDKSTTLAVTCTQGGTYTIGLSAGGGKNATTTTRSMTGATNKASLNYALFIDKYNGTNWDNAAATGTNVKTGIGTGSTDSITVYGVLPTGQTPLVADSYSDTITATVTY